MREREERFVRLFNDAYAPLWAYARRRVAPSDVDDIVADALSVAWRRLDAVPHGDRALPWLYGVAYKAIGNHHRSDKRRLALVDRIASQPPHESVSESAATAATLVLDALETMRAADREVLRLATWEELNPAEIAVVLGCSTNAATLRLSRARKRLRELLTESSGSRTQTPRKEIDV